ncbi:MAG: hypothetical protein HYR62_06405 [Actinobacteria bacterium]|nr:hypothetical protein [Actinomycetota bacterium]MBI3686741.1 hypothetical protein [Actinomycetota bacterium]
MLDIRDGIENVARFEVQPEQLGQAGVQAGKLAEAVRGLLAALDPVERAAPLGFHIERALDEALTGVRASLSELAGALDQHGTALSQAGAAYRGTDAAATRAARQTADGS